MTAVLTPTTTAPATSTPTTTATRAVGFHRPAGDATPTPQAAHVEVSARPAPDHAVAFANWQVCNRVADSPGNPDTERRRPWLRKWFI